MRVSDVNLAGDGGGDQGSAVFLEAFDGSFDFRGEGVELGGLELEVVDDCTLFRLWRRSERHFCQSGDVDMADRGAARLENHAIEVRRRLEREGDESLDGFRLWSE